MMSFDPASVLDSLERKGCTWAIKGGVFRVQKASLLSEDQRSYIDRHRDLLGAYALSREWEQHVPATEVRPCENPRRHDSAFCVRSLDKSLLPCGDCGIAEVAGKLNKLREIREKAE